MHEPTDPEAPAPPRPVVLVVDDDPDLRTYIRLSLSHFVEVIEASNGIEAIELANRHRDQLKAVITDVVMPRMSGTELRAQLRAHGSLARVPVLMITGAGTEPLDGATLAKPFTGRALRVRLSTLLNSTLQNQEFSE